MTLVAFAIRDAKIEAYNTPFFQKTKGEAIRNFSSAVKDDKTQFCKHPEDFDLYEVGQWDDNKGTLVPLDSPKHVVKAIDFVEQ